MPRLSIGLDDWWTLKRRTQLELRHLIIRVHEHYLGMDFDSRQEEDTMRRVAEVLEREISVQLESDPASSSIRLWSEVSWVSRVLRRKQPIEEVFSFAP